MQSELHPGVLRVLMAAVAVVVGGAVVALSGAALYYGALTTSFHKLCIYIYICMNIYIYI